LFKNNINEKTFFCDKCKNKCGEVSLKQLKEELPDKYEKKCISHPNNIAIKEAFSKIKGSTKKYFFDYFQEKGTDSKFCTIANYILSPQVTSKLTGDFRSDIKVIRLAIKKSSKNSTSEYINEVVKKLEEIKSLALDV